MRVLITGGNGLIGQAVAAHLLQRGFEVHLTDLTDETQVPHTTYARCDVTRYDEVAEQVRGCDVVVHMAALRGPMHDIGPIVYHVNTVGTFNVFEAAARAGIRRVVQASSINAIGCA
ncbi:MAG: NAD(P)-dependent oxidoreductase [Chloroflexota bacterium]|nr:NAD(P)-dependent oxidoreductase [Chloroflexota bacterium]